MAARRRRSTRRRRLSSSTACGRTIAAAVSGVGASAEAPSSRTDSAARSHSAAAAPTACARAAHAIVTTPPVVGSASATTRRSALRQVVPPQRAGAEAPRARRGHVPPDSDAGSSDASSGARMSSATCPCAPWTAVACSSPGSEDRRSSGFQSGGQREPCHAALQADPRLRGLRRAARLRRPRASRRSPRRRPSPRSWRRRARHADRPALGPRPQCRGDAHGLSPSSSNSGPEPASSNVGAGVGAGGRVGAAGGRRRRRLGARRRRRGSGSGARSRPGRRRSGRRSAAERVACGRRAAAAAGAAALQRRRQVGHRREDHARRGGGSSVRRGRRAAAAPQAGRAAGRRRRPRRGSRASRATRGRERHEPDRPRRHASGHSAGWRCPATTHASRRHGALPSRMTSRTYFPTTSALTTRIVMRVPAGRKRSSAVMRPVPNRRRRTRQPGPSQRTSTVAVGGRLDAQQRDPGAAAHERPLHTDDRERLQQRERRLATSELVGTAAAGGGALPTGLLEACAARGRASARLGRRRRRRRGRRRRYGGGRRRGCRRRRGCGSRGSGPARSSPRRPLRPDTHQWAGQIPHGAHGDATVDVGGDHRVRRNGRRGGDSVAAGLLLGVAALPSVLDDAGRIGRHQLAVSVEPTTGSPWIVTVAATVVCALAGAEVQSQPPRSGSPLPHAQLALLDHLISAPLLSMIGR